MTFSECRALLVSPRFNGPPHYMYKTMYDVVRGGYPTPPLGLPTVAALLPRNWKLRLIDRNFEKLGVAEVRRTRLRQRGTVRMRLRELRAFARVAWCMTVTHPDLRRHFWGDLIDCARNSPWSTSAVMVFGSIYLDIGESNRHVVATMTRQVDAIARGEWTPLRAPLEAVPSQPTQGGGRASPPPASARPLESSDGIPEPKPGIAV